MTAATATATSLLRLEERLRQERETFDQRKIHEARWFNLRLLIGYIAAVLVPGVAIACGYVLFLHEEYPAVVISSAGVVLFVDMVTLAGTVWKIVLNPAAIGLEPITSSEE